MAYPHARVGRPFDLQPPLDPFRRPPLPERVHHPFEQRGVGHAQGPAGFARTRLGLQPFRPVGAVGPVLVGRGPRAASRLAADGGLAAADPQGDLADPEPVTVPQLVDPDAFLCRQVGIGFHIECNAFSSVVDLNTSNHRQALHFYLEPGVLSIQPTLYYSSMPKLSIIVPIYNVEDFLDQCLASIQQQTFKDWECLLFSDGSKDSSIDIMKRFASSDNRFKVIEKQNEGYGATCNRGLDQAVGEWISIIEPDDFIDPHMYENLLSAKESGKGQVDIVKGSYWLYYDAQEPYTDALGTPNLARFMPRRLTEFSLEEFTEPFYHHPSIWSAIYRRDFLNGDNKSSHKIRFMPIPGAGWTDNPFFAETLVLANRIVWAPGQYYFYRQTNPGASTFLRDFHLPFDRLRDMRKFLDSQHVSRNILHAFYSREFDYVTSVIGEFGYDDKNPEVRKLIREVFESMDREEVFLMRGLRPEFLDYYMDFMGDSYIVKEHDDATNPDLSIVILAKNARSWIIETLESYASFNHLSCEFIIIDDESKDSTLNVADKFAHSDKRFIVNNQLANSQQPAGENETTFANRISLAIANAHGRYTIFVPSNFTVGEKLLYASVAAAKKTDVDVAILDNGNVHSDYLLKIMRDKGLQPPSEGTRDITATRGPIYGPFTASDIPQVLFATNRDLNWLKLYRTEFLQKNNITAGSNDVPSTLYNLSGKALLQAGRIAYLDLKEDWVIRNIQRQQVGSAFWLALVKNIPYSSGLPDSLPSVLEFGDYLKEQGIYKTYEQGYLNSVITTFVNDIYFQYTPEAIDKYLKVNQKNVENLLDIKHRKALYFYDVDAFNDFQKITLSGNLNLWLEERALRDEEGIFARDREIRDLKNSARLKVGEKIIGVIKTLSPSSIIAKAQAKVHVSKRNR